MPPKTQQQQQRPKGASTSNKSPGSHNRKFKAVKAATPGTAPTYALRTDLTSVLWQGDSEIERCPVCNKEFGFFRRMHHCRACGLIFCNDHCQEDDFHDNERVCVYCLRALEELNQQARQELADRIRRAEEATALLRTIDDRVLEDRRTIIDEEAEARLHMMDQMREEQRLINADIRDKIASVVGSVAQMERRRTRPIYGLRGGILRLRVQRVRNLQPVKTTMTCAPHVVVQCGSFRQRSASATMTAVTSGRSSLDFSFEELFVFDVENDKDGVLISVLDEESIPGVSVLLGIAYLNIRKMNVIEEEVDWKTFDETTGNAGSETFETAENPTQSSFEREVLHQQRRRKGSLFRPQESTAYGMRTGESQLSTTELLVPGGENLPGAVLASKVHLSASATKLLTKYNSNTTEEEMRSITRFKENDRDNSAPNTNNLLSNEPRSPVMKNKSKDDFNKCIERGSATRALCDFAGHALTSAQVTISWSFHPYRLDARARQLALSVLCEGCKQKDAPGYCLCGDLEKEQEDEDVIKSRLRQAGGEIHALEMRARAKQASNTSGSNKSREPTTGGVDFGTTPVPQLAPFARDSVETCCC